MNSSNTIAAQWQAFEAAVVPKAAPAIQRREMRIAFYAGASALLSIAYDIGGGGVSEDAGVHILKSLHQETSAFASELARGQI